MDNRKPDKVQLSTSSVQYMPVENPNYDWRIRVDVRCGVDMPLNSASPSRMPSIYAEVCWSESIFYESLDPLTLQYTCIVKENRHPNWNQQLLVTNPPTNPDVEGFLWISLAD